MSRRRDGGDASALANQAEFGLLGAAAPAIAWIVDVTNTPALCLR